MRARSGVERRNSWRLVVPAEQRERVLTESHCLTSSGHLGAKKTYDRLACEYWWPGMWYAVEEYCNSCDVCQRFFIKYHRPDPKGLMTRRVVDRPWAVVAADMMEFPRNGAQHQRGATAFVCRRCQGSNRKDCTVSPAGDGRASGGASSSERNASEEARASQEAVAELNEYVRLMELGVPARLRPEPEGRAVVEVSGELIPVFCEAFDARIGGRDGLGGVRSARQYSWQRPAWQQRTDADRRRASRQRRQASGVGTRQRTPSPGEGRRPPERRRSRCWRRRHGQCWSSWWRPVNRWKNGTARHSRRFFVARLKRKFCCWRRGRRRLRFVAQVRRRRKAHGCRPHLWHPFKNHLRCRCLHQFSSGMICTPGIVNTPSPDTSSKTFRSVGAAMASAARVRRAAENVPACTSSRSSLFQQSRWRLCTCVDDRPIHMMRKSSDFVRARAILQSHCVIRLRVRASTQPNRVIASVAVSPSTSPDKVFISAYGKLSRSIRGEIQTFLREFRRVVQLDAKWISSAPWLRTRLVQIHADSFFYNCT
ncbi:unnamed protein product [Trichogramma brassicae]|uniref:Integrase zinc-binding domain-containing protein n=1 Tax=Trichogramma brassicae TaxID=86971 RepID=A0A6H5IC78_9HYME|nr:unnamed protein product [Trichogramma brassicae]